MWITVTPLLDISWEYDTLYVPGKKGSATIGVHEVSTSENIYVSEAQMSILTDGMGDAEREARLTGHFMQQHGTIFKGAFTHKNIIPPIIHSDTWPLFNKWGCIAGFDHGFTNPTAVLLALFDQEGKIVIIDEYYETGRIVSENAAALKKWFKSVKTPEYISADPSIRNKDPISGGSILIEYAENGIYLSLANNDVDAGIARLRGRFKNEQLLITSNCERLIWELERYQYAKYVNRKTAERNNIKEQPLKKNDHAIDALRYVIMSRPSLPGEIDTRVGNILNSSVAIDGTRIDEELFDKAFDQSFKAVFDEYGMEI